MKKAIILIVSLVCIFTVGCTNHKVERAENLEEAYYSVLEKRINKEEISKKYLSMLLKGYEYKKGEELKIDSAGMGTTDHIQQPYEFTSGDESLTLTYIKENNKEIIEPLYSFSKDNTNLSLSFLDKIDDDQSDRNNFMFIMTSDDINTHENISKKVFDSTRWSDIYSEVAKNIASSKDISINDIKEMVKEEPVTEEYEDNLAIYQNEPILSQNYNLTTYTFENGDETLSFEYIKEKDKIWNAYYMDNKTGTSRNTLDKPLINPSEKFHTGLATYVKSKDIQKEILTELKK